MIAETTKKAMCSAVIPGVYYEGGPTIDTTWPEQMVQYEPQPESQSLQDNKHRTKWESMLDFTREY